MINYNFVIIDYNKAINSFLNFVDEDDDLNCFAFTVSDEKLDVREYDKDRALSFVLNKIKKTL